MRPATVFSKLAAVFSKPTAVFSRAGAVLEIHATDADRADALFGSCVFGAARRHETRYLLGMSALKVHVENGRIKLDEPTDLPNGTELYLVPAEQLEDVVLLHDDGLGDDERKELLESIDESLVEADAGKVEDFSKLIAEMRRQS